MTTTVVNDYDAQAEGELDIDVRNDVSDLPIEGAMARLYNADGELVRECEFTDDDGEVDFDDQQGGVYTVSVSADGFEQESFTFEYSPLADAADGNVDDEDEAADYVAALDPFQVG